MFRKETTTFARGAKPDVQEMAVAYFLEGVWNSDDAVSDDGPMSAAEQRRVVQRDAKITGTTIALSFTDIATESGTNRPGLRALLDEAQRRGITRCLVADNRCVASYEGAELFWNAMFQMSGVELIAVRSH
jgi:hypothetical protein